MDDLAKYSAPNTEMTIDELAFEANEYERRSTKGIQWVIIYKINSGERLLAIQSKLDSRKFDPWLRVPDNFISGRTEAYKNMALARAKDSIRSHVERIECVSDAFELIGKYIRVPITDIQTETPESPPADDGVSPDIVSGMPPSEPGPLANGSGGSPAPTEAEQAILDRLLKPGEAAGFESGLDLPDEYQCYLCSNWFFADQITSRNCNRYCYSCLQQLPDPGNDQQVESAADTSGYETTLFDEPLPETNGQAVGVPLISGEPPPMTVQDPYDEMIMLAKILFPKFSSMECMSTYGITGEVRRFIDLFTEIHQL